MRIEELVFDAHHAWRILDRAGCSTREEIAGRARTICTVMRGAGVGSTSRVALVADNGAGFIVGLAGILATGATAVVLDPSLPDAALRRRLRACGASHACVTSRHARRGLEVAITELDTASASETCARAHGAESPALVLASSGSTGEPKAPVLSHRAILANICAITEYLEPTSDDIFYIAKSMVHASTLVGEVLTAMWAGAQLVALDPSPSPSQLFRRLEQHAATIVCVNPSLLAFFSGPAATPERLRSVRAIHVSGSVVDASVFLAVHEKFPWIRMFNGYGLTETGPRVSQASTAGSWKPGSVGRPISGVAVEIRRPDRSPCVRMEIGQIHVSSRCLMEGYLTEAGSVVAPVLDGGYFGTGDLGYLDEEGELFVTGRADEMIITSGHNIDPREVEAVVLGVLGVSACVVFGVDDRLLGQRVVCAYTADPASVDLSHAIRDRCARSLPGHHIPKQIRCWPAIPSTTNGKPSRRMARDRFLREDDA